MGSPQLVQALQTTVEMGVKEKALEENIAAKEAACSLRFLDPELSVDHIWISL
jgi:hypothetical protein